MLRPISAGILIIAAGFYIEIPGPHRVLTPASFGLSEVSPGIFTDAPTRAPEIRSMIRKARSNSASFFGSSDVEPRMVICTSQPCADIFDMKALGLAIGYHAVLIAPQGVNERTLTHERAHIDLHARMGPQDLIAPRFPSWFDEGLASLVAGDNRMGRPHNPREADWIRAARTWRQWNALTRKHSAGRTYGAAARLVSEIEDRAGRHGLKLLIDEVAAGADFTTTYETLIGL